MSRGMGSFEESMRVQTMMESRESGAESEPMKGNMETPYMGGKTQPTLASFPMPKGMKGMKMRKHLE